MITPSFNLTATERVLPKLALDFTTASLDSRVTFTRTTGASNPATYVNSSGIITAATNDQPRFDYNPLTLACKGLLIEESRANILLRSQELGNTAWVNFASRLITLSDDAGYPLAPDGTQTTDKLIATSVSGSHNNAQVVTLADNTVYSFSTFFRAAEYSFAVLLHLTKSGGAPQATFNLTAKTVTLGGGATSGSIEEYANGWFRCTLVFNSGTGASGTQARMYLHNGSGTSFAGNDSDGIYAWGAQLETGAFPTSYIPTTTTALTRNADVATMTGTNFSSWFNASAGAIETQALVKDLGSSIYPGWLAIDDGTTNNEALIIYAYVTGVTSLVRHSSANTFSLNRNGILSSTPSVVKALLSYANSDFKATYQGATPATQASGTIPSGLVQMRIGVYSSRQINGHIQKINYWPQSLQTAEVQAFTK